jgi:hypothetical protein
MTTATASRAAGNDGGRVIREEGAALICPPTAAFDLTRRSRYARRGNARHAQPVRRRRPDFGR